MQNFFGNLKQKLARMLYGVYGQDELSKELSTFGLICLIISLFPYLKIFYIIGFVCVVWAFFRTFSKNHARRMREREAYLKFTAKPRAAIRLQKRRFADRKTHDYYKCTRCKTYNRIPKGHGKIIITCPKCKNQFEAE
ncbi:MAG: hypothetical protein IJW18_06925 [Lachnospiraceae bacterium]|nr:hypothetical protein [Lachnospiraceae bacterium]